MLETRFYNENVIALKNKRRMFGPSFACVKITLAMLVLY